MTFITFIFIFFIIFGPKFSIIDSSVLVPSMILLILMHNNMILNRKFLYFSFFILLILAYQLLVQLVNTNFDLSSDFRLLRAIIQVVISSLFFRLIMYKIQINKIVDIFIFTLLLHSLLVILAVLFEPLNFVLSDISGNMKVREFRASGLLSGFDIAGVIAIIGIISIFLNTFSQFNTIKKFIYVSIFVLSTVFTSRMTLFFAILLVLISFFIYLFRNRKNTKVIASSFILLLISISIFYEYISLFFEYLELIIEYTFRIGLVEISNEENTFISNKYSSNTSEVLFNMYFMPTSFFNALFGLGSSDINSDVGYVKNIFRVGIFGLFTIIVGFIYFTYIYTKKSYSKSWLWTILMIIFIFTFKNDYLFVRGVFPIFIIISNLYINNQRLLKCVKY